MFLKLVWVSSSPSHGSALHPPIEPGYTLSLYIRKEGCTHVPLFVLQGACSGSRAIGIHAGNASLNPTRALLLRQAEEEYKEDTRPPPPHGVSGRAYCYRQGIHFAALCQNRKTEGKEMHQPAPDDPWCRWWGALLWPLVVGAVDTGSLAASGIKPATMVHRPRTMTSILSHPPCLTLTLNGAPSTFSASESSLSTIYDRSQPLSASH